MKIAVTGHRPNKLGNEYALHGPYSDYIRAELQKVIDSYKPTAIISGMALGVDTIWALLGITNSVPVIAAIPCKGQDSKWPKNARVLYQMILSYPLVTIEMVSNELYSFTCMQNRNKWMVDNCDFLVAVWDGSEGGTANCVDYALKAKKELIIISPNAVI